MTVEKRNPGTRLERCCSVNCLQRFQEGMKNRVGPTLLSEPTNIEVGIITHGISL